MRAARIHASRPSRLRADARLVAQGLAESLPQAQALIMAGRVWMDGERVEKAGQPVSASGVLTLQEAACPFASRAGAKLAGALEAFGIDVSGRVCLDVGASTGGFTDCLLQRGAALVMALDVGRGQLDWRLCQDPRVIRLEGINARLMRRDDLPRQPDLVTVDVAFISLAAVLPALFSAVAAGREEAAISLIALVKPQFELPRERVGAGGIVRDEAARAHALARVAEAVVSLGWQVVGTSESPLPGSGGNREWFLHGRKCKAAATAAG